MPLHSIKHKRPVIAFRPHWQFPHLPLVSHTQISTLRMKWIEQNRIQLCFSGFEYTEIIWFPQMWHILGKQVFLQAFPHLHHDGKNLTQSTHRLSTFSEHNQFWMSEHGLICIPRRDKFQVLSILLSNYAKVSGIHIMDKWPKKFQLNT